MRTLIILTKITEGKKRVLIFVLLLLKFQPTQDQEYKEDIIYTILLFKRLLNRQSEMREFSNMQAVILSGILLLHIFLNQAAILEQYKNY